MSWTPYRLCWLLAPSQAVPVLPVAGGMMPPIPAVPIHSHHHQREHHHHHQEEQQQQYHQYNRPSQPSFLQRSPSTAAPAPAAALPTPPSRAATAPRGPAEANSASNNDADVGAVTLPSPVQAAPGLPILAGVPGSKICCVWLPIPHDWPGVCGRGGVTHSF